MNPGVYNSPLPKYADKKFEPVSGTYTYDTVIRALSIYKEHEQSRTMRDFAKAFVSGQYHVPKLIDVTSNSSQPFNLQGIPQLVSSTYAAAQSRSDENITRRSTLQELLKKKMATAIVVKDTPKEPIHGYSSFQIAKGQVNNVGYMYETSTVRQTQQAPYIPQPHYHQNPGLPSLQPHISRSQPVKSTSTNGLLGKLDARKLESLLHRNNDSLLQFMRQNQISTAVDVNKNSGSSIFIDLTDTPSGKGKRKTENTPNVNVNMSKPSTQQSTASMQKPAAWKEVKDNRKLALEKKKIYAQCQIHPSSNVAAAETHCENQLIKNFKSVTLYAIYCNQFNLCEQIHSDKIKTGKIHFFQINEKSYSYKTVKRFKRVSENICPTVEISRELGNDRPTFMSDVEDEIKRTMRIHLACQDQSHLEHFKLYSTDNFNLSKSGNIISFK